MSHEISEEARKAFQRIGHRTLPLVQDSAGNIYQVNKDMTGMRFGHLTVLYLDWVNPYNMKYYRVQCDCGNEATFPAHDFRKKRRTCCSKLCRFYHEDIIDKEKPGLREADPALFHNIVMKHCLDYKMQHVASVMDTMAKLEWEAQCYRLQTDLKYGFMNKETIEQVKAHTYVPRSPCGVHRLEIGDHKYKEILENRMPTELIRRDSRPKVKKLFPYRDLNKYIARHYKNRFNTPFYKQPQKIKRRAIHHKNTMSMAEIAQVDFTGRIIQHTRVLCPMRDTEFQANNFSWQAECIFCKKKYTIPARLLASGGFRACRCLDLKLAALEEQMVEDAYHDAMRDYYDKLHSVRSERKKITSRTNNAELNAYKEELMKNRVKRLQLKSDVMDIDVNIRYLGQFYFNYLFNLNDIAMLGYEATVKDIINARNYMDTKAEKKGLKQLERFKTLEQYTNDMFKKPYILQGKNFGTLHVLRIDHIDELTRQYWLCECRSCGKKVVIDVPSLILHYFRGCDEDHEIYDPVEEKYRPTPEEKSKWL